MYSFYFEQLQGLEKTASEVLQSSEPCLQAVQNVGVSVFWLIGLRIGYHPGVSLLSDGLVEQGPIRRDSVIFARFLNYFNSYAFPHYV